MLIELISQLIHVCKQCFVGFNIVSGSSKAFGEATDFKCIAFVVE